MDVVIRPEDVDIVPEDQGQLKGTVTYVTFKGMQYDIIVDFYGFKWLIQTTDLSPVGSRIGIKIDPDGFHVMKKSQYSGMFGDYSSYTEEYDEISDAAYDPEEAEGEEAGDEGNKRSLFAIPYVVWMAIFVVIPILMVVVYAFTSAGRRLHPGQLRPHLGLRGASSPGPSSWPSSPP